MADPNQEEQLYAQAAAELDGGKRDEGLWAKCFAECDGDENKAKALYLKTRVGRLAEEPSTPKKSTKEKKAGPSEKPAPKPTDDESESAPDRVFIVPPSTKRHEKSSEEEKKHDQTSGKSRKPMQPHNLREDIEESQDWHTTKIDPEKSDKESRAQKSDYIINLTEQLKSSLLIWGALFGLLLALVGSHYLLEIYGDREYYGELQTEESITKGVLAIFTSMGFGISLFTVAVSVFLNPKKWLEDHLQTHLVKKLALFSWAVAIGIFSASYVMLPSKMEVIKSELTNYLNSPKRPLTPAQEDQAARSIYIDMRYDFRNWKEAIKEGDSFDQQKYQERITIDLENNLDKYPDANRDSIRRKVYALNLDDD